MESEHNSILISSDDPNIGLEIYKKLESLNSDYELNKIKPNLYRLKIKNINLIKESFLQDFNVVLE